MRILDTMVACLFTLCACASANAADLGKPSTPQGTVASYDESPWTGAYIGVHGGWSQSDFTRALTAVDEDGPVVGDVLPIHEAYSSDDWLFGVQLGAQRQFGHVVLGFEVDASWLDAEAGVSTSYADVPYDGETLTFDHSTSIDWLATARARVGLPINDRILPYVTGGAAFASVNESTAAAITHVDGDDEVVTDFSANATLPDDIRFGWTIGGGFDVNLGSGYSIGAEYLYVDLNDSKIRAAVDGAGTAEFRANNEMDIIRAKLNYRF